MDFRDTIEFDHRLYLHNKPTARDKGLGNEVIYSLSMLSIPCTKGWIDDPVSKEGGDIDGDESLLSPSSEESYRRKKRCGSRRISNVEPDDEEECYDLAWEKQQIGVELNQSQI